MTMLVVDGKSKRKVSFLKAVFPYKIVGIFFSSSSGSEFVWIY